MFITDGALRVLVGRLSLSDTVTSAVEEPVLLLFTDNSGFITCSVCILCFFTYLLTIIFM